MIRRGVLAAMAGLSVACRAERPAAGAARAEAIPELQGAASLAIVGRVTGSGVEWQASRRDDIDSVGLVVGDSAVRARRWPTASAPVNAMHQLCGAIALGRVPSTAADPLALPADSVQPALGIRRLGDPEPLGVRWLVPGAQAQYRFEGVTRDGRQRVSLRWPVRSDPGRRIPASAPDSVIEAALDPAPDSLDALVRQLTNVSAAPPLAVSRDVQAPRQADAIRLYSDLPFHTITLPLACPAATFRIPMLARADQRIRIPVQAGDELEAYASVEYGAVQVGFEEAGLDLPATGFVNVPQARVTASHAGQLTLRLSLQVIAKRQRSDQDVLLRLTRRHP